MWQRSEHSATTPGGETSAVCSRHVRACGCTPPNLARFQGEKRINTASASSLWGAVFAVWGLNEKGLLRFGSSDAEDRTKASRSSSSQRCAAACGQQQPTQQARHNGATIHRANGRRPPRSTRRPTLRHLRRTLFVEVGPMASGVSRSGTTTHLGTMRGEWACSGRQTNDWACESSLCKKKKFLGEKMAQGVREKKKTKKMKVLAIRSGFVKDLKKSVEAV